MNNSIAEIFDLEGLRIYSIKKTTNSVKLRVAPTIKRIECECRYIYTKRGNKHSQGKLTTYQHGIVNGKPLELEVKRNRFKCPECGRVTTESLGKLELSNGHNRTKNYDELVLQRLSTSPTISTTAKVFEITDSKVRNILLTNTSKALSSINSESILGIDEKRWLKKDYHLVITSITEKILLALGKNRSKTTLLEILATIKNIVTPKAFCIDMWRPFRNAIYEIFGNNMPIVIDKYHVFALVNRYILQSKDIMEFSIDKTLPSFRPLLYSKKNLRKSKVGKIS